MANHIFFVLCCLSTILIGCNCAEVGKNGEANEGSTASILPSNNPNVTTDHPSPNVTTTTTSSPLPTTTTSKTTPKPTNPTSTLSPTTTPAPGPNPTNGTTVKPTTTTTPPTPSNKDDRSFDLPSFIGGVILSLGLAAIGYVVYKFYRTRTDPNYRTL